jgi:hypothetical protein
MTIKQLESFEQTSHDINEWMQNTIELINRSSSSIILASESLDRISNSLSQTSEIWALQLLSQDFSSMLKETGGDLESISMLIHDLEFNDIVKTLTNIENFLHFGFQIISFLKNAIKTMLTIFSNLINRFESMQLALHTIKNVSLILVLDAFLIHLSLALIGLYLFLDHQDKTSK